MQPIAGLDHVLVAVCDLESAYAEWLRLGFVLSPRGRHKGWGKANYCAMLAGDYIEILGVVDPSQPIQGLDRFLAAQGEGLLGLAFSTTDTSAAAAAFERAGIPATHETLSRWLELPEGAVEPRFALIKGQEVATRLGVFAFACSHLTPELMRRPEWLRHPNTARRLRTITGCVRDPAAHGAAWTALLGEGAVRQGPDYLALQLGGPSGGVTLHLGAGPKDCLLGFGVEVAEIARARLHLARNGVAFEDDGRALHIPPTAANGLALTLMAG